MLNDKYGRTVTLVTTTVDTYTIKTGGTTNFIIAFPIGTATSVIYNAIESMAPQDVGLGTPYLDQIGYTGYATIGLDSPGPVTVTLPPDITASYSPSYTVGLNKLSVFLNGMALILGSDYTEVGSYGTPSTTIVINQDLAAPDLVFFQIR